LEGVHFAMDYLVPANRVVAGETVENQIHAKGRHVVILGGGDTGADCLGTAHRHGAASVTTLAIGKQPPSERAGHQPWPTFPTLQASPIRSVPNSTGAATCPATGIT